MMPGGCEENDGRRWAMEQAIALCANGSLPPNAVEAKATSIFTWLITTKPEVTPK